MNTFIYHLWPYAHMLDKSATMVGAQTVPSGDGNAFMQVRIIRKLEIKAYLGTPSFLMTLSCRAPTSITRLKGLLRQVSLYLGPSWSGDLLRAFDWLSGRGLAAASRSAQNENPFPP
ncbi:hypothetical protein DFAR_3990030 [Desulfarculales bacterium]